VSVRTKLFGGVHEALRPHVMGTRFYCAWALLGDLAYSRQLGEPGEVGIRWFEVQLLEGPMPPGWEAPDWSNYERWRSERKLHSFPAHNGTMERGFSVERIFSRG